MATQPLEPDYEPRPAVLGAPNDAMRMARIEERLARVEAYLELAPGRSGTESGPPARTEDELEIVVGQDWFARVGIVVLAAGIAFTLSLPYPALPAAAPSLIGYALVASLFVLARLWRRTFELVSATLRGAAILLLFFATLRLFFFGSDPVFRTNSIIGQFILAAAVALNAAIALRRKSPWLFALALLTGFAAALAVGLPWYVLVSVAILCALLVAASEREDLPALLLFGIPAAYLTLFLWAINDPLLGRTVALASGPISSLAFILACVALLACGSLFRGPSEGGEILPNLGAMLNCALGYGVYLLHSLAWFDSRFVGAQIAASLVFLGLAAAFDRREGSAVPTFFYAMTGYAALTLAIFKAAPVPDVFVWLSVQSVIVVATAIAFRSRFIVIANFAIFLAIMAGYAALARRESGISFCFGAVALVSARLLGWKKNRLELKTEAMRNAYLASAFVAFPYALDHLVPGGYVALAWVVIALFYYAMSAVLANRKYRWMGHGTLLLTALYLAVAALSRFDPVVRNLSFLVLGSVLLTVSLVFTKLRMRRQAALRGTPVQR